MTSVTDHLDRAVAWAAGDPDPGTRAALTALVERARAGDAAAGAEVADAVAADLAFGTAGLRGRLGPGPNRMNRAVVIRAAAALGGFLGAALGGEVPVVVVGHDARHGSAGFAADTAAVLVAAGCRVLLVPRPTPTPVIAAAVRRLGADAGVVVTASHNPPQDNGYKVYLGGRVAPDPGAGVQIVPPVDSDIAARIAACPPAADVPRAAAGWEVLGDEAVADYVTALLAAVLPGEPAAGPRALTVVATAMHGVGADVLDRVLGAAGFAAVHWVAEQREPDPDFPTVAFPNPEIAGAMDLAFARAREVGADLVVALDPDADRCALAVPDPAVPGGWRRLTGDEAGVVLGEDRLASRAPAADPGLPRAVATSLVSSSMLASVAADHDVACETTLTGFKWIARVPGLVYGYEEAIGYCVAPGVTRDKDGIATALVACLLAARLAAEGRGLQDVLDDLSRRHGVHLTAPVTVRLAPGQSALPLLDRLLAQPPDALAGRPVTEVSDLSAGVDGLPPTPGARLRAGSGVRVVVRPSGTEPLLKAYLEVVAPVPAGTPIARVRDDASQVLDTLRDDVAALLGGGSSAVRSAP